MNKIIRAYFGKLSCHYSRVVMTPRARAQTILETLLVSGLSVSQLPLLMAWTG